MECYNKFVIIVIIIIIIGGGGGGVYIHIFVLCPTNFL